MADVDIANVTVGTADSGDDVLGVARPANVARLFSVSSIIALAQAFASPLLAPDGSAANPSHSFTNDPNTGLWSAAADTIGFSTGGTNRLSVSTTQMSASIPLYLDIGGVVVGVASNRGIGSLGGDQVYLTSGGVNSISLRSGYAYVPSNAGLGWNPDADAPTNTAPDTGLIRQAAAIIALTNGSTGGASLLFREQTAPTGVANSAIVYAVDNGSGKTRLMAIFGSGAAQQLAIEP